MIEFAHKAPKGYSYEFEQFKRNVVAIWIRNHSEFSYNGGAPIKSIWGFYNSKTREYHAPVNPKKVGDVVDFNSTTPYSAMQLNLKGLEVFFQ
ncbi:hypothetical protein HOU04_gp216 [Synechococcus phage S-T4]|jgi:hypothetical protein|uniref:Uncharacterized protein n=1 Tax=Synechococcus phage S-T4 TaxID=2268578 RepID=A0A385EF45_9CAUD|nr:hypothetical protein HOU04_gp014 [Synechococcus phage S-T4]YP_009810974.1 hypothetical protein HOU04_gp216 [Synechococcus phage S-T4]AXQ70413.1 hypothetical protein [Synechococcus phage S-T4]AXQ70615.1 hypothetical protein [Synechococcus phage S-T4]